VNCSILVSPARLGHSYGATREAAMAAFREKLATGLADQ